MPLNISNNTIKINLILIVFLLSVGACNFENNKGNIKQNPSNIKKHKHACKEKSGLTWSIVKNNCIKVNEIGIALTNEQNANKVTYCYLIKSEDNNTIEIFLPDSVEGLIFTGNDNYWKNNLNSYFLKRNLAGFYELRDSAGKLQFHNNEPILAPEDETTDSLYKLGEKRELLDDEIREIGKVVSIEDGPYPMFIITIEFPERNFQTQFNLNIETVALEASDLSDIIGKYINFYYVSKLENILYDITQNGKSLLGEYSPDKDSLYVKETGKLRGANNVTVGDLPSEISILNKEGKLFTFEYFITNEIVNANEQDVTVYFSVRGVNTITYIKVSD